jgi:hypothetical protein
LAIRRLMSFAASLACSVAAELDWVVPPSCCFVGLWISALDAYPRCPICLALRLARWILCRCFLRASWRSLWIVCRCQLRTDWADTTYAPPNRGDFTFSGPGTGLLRTEVKPVVAALVLGVTPVQLLRCLRCYLVCSLSWWHDHHHSSRMRPQFGSKAKLLPCVVVLSHAELPSAPSREDLAVFGTSALWSQARGVLQSLVRTPVFGCPIFRSRWSVTCVQCASKTTSSRLALAGLSRSLGLQFCCLCFAKHSLPPSRPLCSALLSDARHPAAQDGDRQRRRALCAAGLCGQERSRSAGKRALLQTVLRNCVSRRC